MPYPIIQIAVSNIFRDFVITWSKLYNYKNEHIYLKLINKDKKLNKNDLYELFCWKNGTGNKLSSNKLKSYNKKIASKILLINKLRGSDKVDIDFMKTEFRDVSFVWRIFLFHIIKPSYFPIYDQNIHRAFNYIQQLTWENIETNLKSEIKEKFYFQEYLPLILKEVELFYDDKDKQAYIKKIDEALFALGRFLKIYDKHKVFSLHCHSSG